jgi:translation initiation factor 4E
MASVSSLPGPALQASRSAVQAALAEHPEAEGHPTAKDSEVGDDGSLEPGEIQEVDMQAQAETIRTVFSDPKNFNVKVLC